MPSVTVEFFGIPRQRAGMAQLALDAATAAEALALVERHCPRLAPLLQPDRQLTAHYLLSVDGQRFLNDLGERLSAGTHLLLLSADAGG
jgi:molybdopterin converting factor small subunit